MLNCSALDCIYCYSPYKIYYFNLACVMKNIWTKWKESQLLKASIAARKIAQLYGTACIVETWYGFKVIHPMKFYLITNAKENLK